MKEYIYEESDYINPKDYTYFLDISTKHDFDFKAIEDRVEFNIVMQYLINLTEKAVDFLPGYEQALIMIDSLEPDKDLRELKTDLETRYFEACDRITEKEDVFNKVVLWVFMENRPLIRGLYNKANRLWEQGGIDQAHELFSKILKTNESDNIGARYAVKATEEKMRLIEFERRFTFSDESGTFYKPELEEWFSA